MRAKSPRVRESMRYGSQGGLSFAWCFSRRASLEGQGRSPIPHRELDQEQVQNPGTQCPDVAVPVSLAQPWRRGKLHPTEILDEFLYQDIVGANRAIEVCLAPLRIERSPCRLPPVKVQGDLVPARTGVDTKISHRVSQSLAFLPRRNAEPCLTFCSWRDQSGHLLKSLFPSITTSGHVAAALVRPRYCPEDWARR